MFAAFDRFKFSSFADPAGGYRRNRAAVDAAPAAPHTIAK